MQLYREPKLREGDQQVLDDQIPQ